MTKLSGSCLCGEVSFSGDMDIKAVINCHCSDCQNATGSAYGTLALMPEAGLEISGSPKNFSHQADSGNTLTKIFCGNCGTQVFGKNSMREGMIGIRAGVVDQKDAVEPMMNIYCDSALTSTPMSEDLPKHAKMPG